MSTASVNSAANRPSPGGGKPYRGIGMEGWMARWYASMTRKMLCEFQALARQAAAEIPAGGRVLEVAPGPGYFSIELARLGNFNITGLDISRTLVEIARKNADEARVNVDFQWGNASAMPFENDAFDFLLCRAAFKNFTDPLGGALREMRRVLKPGGKVLLIDLRRDVSQESINREVDRMGIGFVNRLITKWTFRCMLIKRAYTKAQFQDLISQAGFGSVDIRETTIGLDIWLGK